MVVIAFLISEDSIEFTANHFVDVSRRAVIGMSKVTNGAAVVSCLVIVAYVTGSAPVELAKKTYN